MVVPSAVLSQSGRLALPLSSQNSQLAIEPRECTTRSTTNATDDNTEGLQNPMLPPSSTSNEISGIFSILSNRPPYTAAAVSASAQNSNHVRWPSLSAGSRSFWTKYCILCTVCGSAATILAGIFLVVAALFRYYTKSINYFETVPTYIPAILLSIVGVSTIAFSCRRNRNIILLRITACWSLCSAALSSVITITTSLIHMNRLQTINLSTCVFNTHPAGCTCPVANYPILENDGSVPPHMAHMFFEDTPDCNVIHGILYSCLRAVFAISVVAVLLSIFLCMLLYQLIGHERKKAYWSRIRRINSDWSTDFVACLARPVPRDRSTVLPLMMSPSSNLLPPQGWGPPPPYEEVAEDPPQLSNRPFLRPLFNLSSSGARGRALQTQTRHIHPMQSQPPRVVRLVTSQSENSFRNADGLISPHPFSPTITSIDPVTVFRHHQEISQSYAGRINNAVNANSSTGIIDHGGSGSLDFGDSSLSTYSACGFQQPGNLRFIQSTSSRIGADLSMSSITSLSIPETLKSTNTLDIHGGDSSIAEILQDLQEEDGSSISQLFGPSSSLLLTEPMIMTGSKGDADNDNPLVDKHCLSSQESDKHLSTAASDSNHLNYSLYDYKSPTALLDDDKLLLIDSKLCGSNKSSFSKISSLPCSPLLQMKKRFWPGGRGKSVQNLYYNSSNLEYENLTNSKKAGGIISGNGIIGSIARRRLSRGKPESCLFIGEEGVEKLPVKGMDFGFDNQNFDNQKGCGRDGEDEEMEIETQDYEKSHEIGDCCPQVVENAVNSEE